MMNEPIYISTANDIAIQISPEDCELVNQFTWSVNSKGYAVTMIPHPKGGFKKNGYKRQTTLYMHRLIKGLQFGDGKQFDHIDGNKLNNTQENLRLCTGSENMWNQGLRKSNTSGYKGVSWHKAHQKWQAHIRKLYKQKHLGLFDTKEEAYEAYCKAARELHGQFARLA